jgi:hypothetical protein
VTLEIRFLGYQHKKEYNVELTCSVVRLCRLGVPVAEASGMTRDQVGLSVLL